MTESPIRTHRRAQGMTADELARKARVGIATIYRAETGAHVPRNATIDAIARALGVPSEALGHEPDASASLPAPSAANGGFDRNDVGAGPFGTRQNMPGPPNAFPSEVDGPDHKEA